MTFEELYPLIHKNPFVIYQQVSEAGGTVTVSARILTRDCRSNNQNLEKQMDESVINIDMAIDGQFNKSYLIIDLTNSN